jgi:signal transduction histidine kinase/CheY-like chemotaxis protein
MRSSGELDLEPELRVSPQPAAIVLIALGFLLAQSAEFLPQSTIAVAIGLTTLASGLTLWLMSLRWPGLARWTAVAVTALLAPALVAWLGRPSLLTLSAIPVGAAAVLVGLRAACATAGLATGLLLLWGALALPGQGLVPLDVAVAVAMIWATTAIAFGIRRPTAQWGRWLGDYYLRTQHAAEEVRARRAEVEQALADLEHANRQLALANERMAVLRAIAEEAQKSKTEFVARVSHEFRTPLNMIIGLVDLLVETPEVYGEALPTALFEDLKIVHRNCEHLSSMVSDVLDLSQVEAARVALRQERVNLPELIDGAVAVVTSLLERKGLALVVDAPPGLPAIYCDPTRIRQVVLNLVSNAVRFTEQGGITIRVTQEGDAIQVSVADTGPGITPEDAQRIFEPFCQGTRGPWRDRGGSGLGLTISKQFIELHGGRIWLESQPGQGATFTFSLPISPPLAPIPHPSRWISEDWKWVERTTRPKTPASPFRPRVVICDETGELAPALGRCSEQVELVTATSLQLATEDLRQCPAHVLLVNASSPERLWPLAVEARSAASDTPIVACCVLSRIDRARAAGALDYLVRPVTRRRLWEAIRAVGRPVQRVLVVDDEEDVRQLLGRMLAAPPQGEVGNGALEITTAADGVAGLAAMRAARPDLVLLDVVLPGMDGWQVLAQKQQDPALRDIPVIMVTAQDRAEQQMRSEAMLATAGHGLSVPQLLQATLGNSAVLLSAA